MKKENKVMKWKRILAILKTMDLEKEQKFLEKIPEISNPPIIN